MSLLVITLLLAGTLFYPYLEMQTNWYTLLFKHWVYQIHSEILLAQAKRYNNKAVAYGRINDFEMAKEMHRRCDIKIAKARVLADGIEGIIENFRRRYV